MPLLGPGSITAEKAGVGPRPDGAVRDLSLYVPIKGRERLLLPLPQQGMEGKMWVPHPTRTGDLSVMNKGPGVGGDNLYQALGTGPSPQ